MSQPTTQTPPANPTSKPQPAPSMPDASKAPKQSTIPPVSENEPQGSSKKAKKTRKRLTLEEQLAENEKKNERIREMLERKKVRATNEGEQYLRAIGNLNYCAKHFDEAHILGKAAADALGILESSLNKHIEAKKESSHSDDF